MQTGLIIDFHVMSSYCQRCKSKAASLLGKAFQQWVVQHKASGNCSQNYVGTSGGMEVEAARVLWSRSLDHGLRFTEFISDGDAKVHSSLTNLKNLYTVEKIECVNHVAKRLGTGLRSLKSSLAKQKVTIGGKSLGSLTDEKIGKLQSYYTNAVRTHNASVSDMANAIWALYYHSISTDESPQHHLCPVGSNSWCFYQRHISSGTPTEGLHAQRPRSTFLNTFVASHVKLVYERLTKTELLERCLSGKTQNPNESFHSLAWARCPKHLFSALQRVNVAVTFAAGEFNQGSSATHEFLSLCGSFTGDHMRALGQRRDRWRLYKSEASLSTRGKERRRKRKAAQQRAAAFQEQREGGQSYQAGGY